MHYGLGFLHMHAVFGLNLDRGKARGLNTGAAHVLVVQAVIHLVIIRQWSYDSSKLNVSIFFPCIILM